MDIEKMLDQLASGLGKLYGLPAVALVMLSCIVVGYILKTNKKFPNDGIPVVVILWGAIFMPILSDYKPGEKIRVWLARNVFVGLITGFVAWLMHNQILSRIEDRLGLFAPKEETPTEETKPNK